MQETGELSVGNEFAGSAAINLVDNAIGDIGHTVFQEIFNDIVQDIKTELQPKAVIDDIVKELSTEFDGLKPSELIRSIIFGK